MTTQASSTGPDGADHRRRVEVAIALVFDREGRLLICRRKAEAVLGGLWEFPGGKCNAGESPEACARREVEEETGLKARVQKPLAVIEHDYAHARVRLHPFVCLWEAGALEAREAAEARWIMPGEIAAYPFPEANAGLLREIAAGVIVPSPAIDSV